jgi:hypothetical protein
MRVILAVYVLALFSMVLFANQPEPCVTDTECFIQCEKEKGRPCTDEDVFGPECEDCEKEEDCEHNDLPADHPDYCPQRS